jgi:CRP/FNR family cyclic AMP-dependent transcriptional regulator
MREILKYCGDIPLQDVAGGTELLAEGQTAGHVYILAKGRVEVLRDDTPVTVIDEPGSLVGEMSVLLGVPHTASVRALGDAKVPTAIPATDLRRNQAAETLLSTHSGSALAATMGRCNGASSCTTCTPIAEIQTASPMDVSSTI